MSWLVNGALECAFIIEQSRTTSSSIDFLELIAVTMDSNYRIELNVSLTDGSALGGTYNCGGPATGPNVMLEVGTPAVAGFSQDCTITIEQAGTATMNAKGTFSGTVAGEGGVTAVTDGKFDVSVMPNGG
jgi:hypothetical protein